MASSKTLEVERLLKPIEEKVDKVFETVTQLTESVWWLKAGVFGVYGVLGTVLISLLLK